MSGPIPLFPAEGERSPLGAPLFRPDTDRLVQSVRLGSATKPDSAARVLSLQEKTGLSPDLIARNLDQLETETAAKDFNAERFRATSPIVASWMAEHPTHAAAAMDDLSQLSTIEATLTALKRGLTIGRETSDTGELGFDELNQGSLDPAQKARLKALQDDITREPAGRNFAESVLFQGAKVIGQMYEGLPSILKYGSLGAFAGAAAGAAGGPLAPASVPAGAAAGFGIGSAAGMGGYTFAVEAGQAYQDMKQITNDAGEHLSEAAMRAAAAGVGVINAALELIGLHGVVGPVARRFSSEVTRDVLTRPTMRAAVMEFGKTYLGALGSETGTEVLQEISSITGEELAKMVSNGHFASIMNDPEQREQAVQRLADIATQTAEGMLMVGLPGASINLAADVVQSRRAQRRADFFTALGESVKDSKTFQRLPEKLQEIVERATKDGPIETAYVDVQPFIEYFQSQNADPREVARDLLGSTDEYDQAVATNGALAIPMSRYATRIAPTEHNAFFSRELRLMPDEINVREADELQKQAEEAAKAEPDQHANVREELTKHVAAMIEQTGRFRGQDAETLASQMAAFFVTQGQRYGIDPTKLFNRYGLQVLRGEPGPTLADVPRPDAEAALERQALQSESPIMNPAIAPASLRDKNGRLPTNLEHATLDQLADELARLYDANQADGVHVVPTVSDEANVSHRDGYLAHHVGMKGQAIMASGRIAARNKSIARLEEAIKAKGADPMELYAKRVAADDVSFNPEEFSQSAIAGENPPSEPSELRDADSQPAGQPQGAKEAPSLVGGGGGYSVAYQRKGDQPRGRIRIMPDRKMAIDLLQNADFSTFLHESGHFYLEVLKDIAGENEENAADFQAILKVLGVQSADQIGREQHEHFARLTEAYFMEGKAPTIELRRAFYRFKTWLKALYQTMRGLEVELTPQVTRVFDRLFATDAEIDAAANEAEIVPVFTTAESAGMSETEFAAYKQTVEDAHIQASDKLRAKAMRDELRQQEQWWKEARAQVRGEVEGETNQEPVYRVMGLLQRGELPDGTKSEAPIKLSREAIVALKGEEFLKRLPRPYVYAKEGGLSPDQVAELYGFSSGDELLTAIANAPNKNQVIEAETDRRMTAQYGDMVIQGKLPGEAEQAVLDDNRADIIRAELRALNKRARDVKPHVDAAKTEAKEKVKTGQRIVAGVPSIETVRQMAKDRIAKLKVRDIRPNVYAVAARRASREAFTAAAKGDYVTAANAKQAELLNVELFREATRIRAETDAIAEYARGLMKTSAQKRLGKAGWEYLEQINNLLERFDFSILPLAEGPRRQSIQAFIKSQEEKGLPVNIPEDIQNEAFRTPWKELTHEELSGVSDTMKHIEHLASLKNKLLTIQAERELDAVTADARQSIEANATKTLAPELETRLPGEQAKRGVGAWFGAHRKLSSLAREFDGWKDNGTMWNLLVRPLNAAADKKAELNAEITAKLSAIFDRHFSKAERAAMYRKEYFPPLHTSLTKMGRLMIALNWGAEDNRTKLMNGLSISTGRPVQASDVEAVIDTLDAKDMEFVQSIWDSINEYWPQLEALAERLDGIAPEKIEAATVRTRHGEYKGGYFPLVYDDRQSRVAHRNLVAKTADAIKRGAAARNSTKAGARNERVEGVRLPVRLDFGVIFEHFEEIAQDLTHTETLLDLGRIVGSDDVEDAIRQHYGDSTYKLILSALEDVAAGDVPAQNLFDKSLNWLRVGTSIAGLGWNVTTSFLQPLGLTQSIVRIGPKWVGRGIISWVRDAAAMENTAAWINEKSPMMRTRTATQMRETAEIRNKIGLTSGRIATYIDMGISKVTLEKLDLQDVEDSYFWLISRMQLVADIPTWLGGYEKALASGVDEATAIALADQGVIDAQGSGSIKDLADVQKGSPALKLWTNFYSFFNTTWNLHAEVLGRTDFKKPASVGRAAVDFLLLSTVPAVLGYVLKSAVKGDDEKDLAGALLREQIGYLINMLVGVRELGTAVAGFHGYEGPAGARFFSEAGKLVKQVGQGDADKAAFKALNNVAGILLHYPAGQVQRTADGLMALEEGRTHNPAALLFGAPRK